MAAPVVQGLPFGASATNAATVTITPINTSQTDYILLLVSYNEHAGTAAATISSVTSTGMTWALRRRSNGSATGCLELWWAHGTGALSSYSVVAHFTGAYDDASLGLIVVTGCGNPAAPFDTNGSLPAAQSAPNNSWTPSFTGISTSNTDDLLLFMTGTISTGGTPATGFTSVVNRFNNGGSWASRCCLDTRSVTALQSSATFTYGGALTNGFSSVIGAEAMFDALSAAAPPVTARDYAVSVISG